MPEHIRNSPGKAGLEDFLAICLALSAERGWFSLDEVSAFVTPQEARPTNLLRVMDKLLHQGLIADCDTRGPGHYLIGKKVDEGRMQLRIPPELHHRLADYFEQTPQGVPSAKIAHHWEGAGQPQRAFPYWIEAVRETFAAGDTRRGMQIVSQAFNVPPEKDCPRDMERLYLKAFVDLFETTPYFRNHPHIDRIIALMQDICIREDGSPLVMTALIYILSSLVWRGRFGQAQPLFMVFFRKSKHTRYPQMDQVRRRALGIAYYVQGKIDRAVRIFDALAGETENLPSDPVLLEYYLGVAHCYVLAGRISRATSLLDSIRTHAHLNAFADIEGWATCTLGVVLIEAGQHDKADLILTELQDIPGWEAHYLSRLGWLWSRVYLAYARGNFTDMVRYAQELDAFSGHRIPDFFMPTVVELGVALANMDTAFLENTGLEHCGGRAQGLMQTYATQPPFRATQQVYEAFYAYLQGGQAETTLAQILAAEEVLGRQGFHLVVGKARILSAIILCEQGRTEEALACLKALSEVLQDFGEDLLGGYLRDLVQPESPERLLLEAVMKISRSLGTVRDKDLAIQKAIEILNRISRAERGAICLNGEIEGHRELVLAASQGLTAEYVGSQVFAGMLDWIRESATSLKGRLWRPPKGQSGLFQPRAALCAPLIIRDQVVGVVYQDNRIRDDLFEGLDLIQALATQIAASLENARAYSRIEHLNNFLLEKNAYYEEELQESHVKEIVAKSRAMKRVLSLALTVAATGSTVLLTGETGVGKDLVAMTIHKQSPRRERPFIRVNCAALPEGLIESELFGHEKGAFTGAQTRRVGRFELAHGGTIFLDEIGELPLQLQAKLLRVLQEGEIEPLGGARQRQVDVRVIAATNRDLELEVQESRFRADLYYRLNAFPIPIPPLRERREDIPVLACHFLSQASKRLGKRFRGITTADIERLKRYGWPGNIRELKHVMERSVILSRGEDFAVVLPAAPAVGEGFEGGLPPLEEMERRYITKVLELCGWRVSGVHGAAEILGLKRSTLVSRMKKLGIVKTWKQSASLKSS